jgi:hypothetical protein
LRHQHGCTVALKLDGLTGSGVAHGIPIDKSEYRIF